MNYSIIGNKIKELRQVVDITQGELADGICTQALISRMEKGDIYPNATTLYQISKKLGVDVNYFFEIGMTPRLDYIQEVERQLRKLRINHQYIEMMEMVKNEEDNPLFKDNVNAQLLCWHKGIYQFEVVKDQDTAFDLLHKAFHLTADSKKVLSEREMEILLTLGAFHFSNENYQKSLCHYSEVKAAVSNAEWLQDKSIKTRLLYNMARVYTRLGDYQESIQYCKKAIKWIIKEEHMYGFAQLHYHLGYNLELQGEYEKAFPYYKKAAAFFEIQNNLEFVRFIRRKIDQLRNESGKISSQKESTSL
ncbi:helix-turn-helix transcriptional regulator [Rossellomorea sp. SC111]|uniref:helix-turn-helix transcriptional regulator n=1 Tax=Rossellomorea sp. SC111 TaxID=2968985 RepID=UPI00215AACF4|nr:helix-turn-helix transcriptional regulator [Rossellomorea sp. SC111]MCR8850419.1 helix-turn-helix transcriptional regulator [Rossellomorea sp. SC111]